MLWLLCVCVCVCVGYCDVSLGVSGDPPHEELVTRDTQRGRVSWLILGLGSGGVCWAHPTEHLWQMHA